MRYFELHWKTGEIDEVSSNLAGDTLDVLADAVNKAGYGFGALPALDYWREVTQEDEESYES